MYDLIIVGSGPAGLTAAIYAARFALDTLVIGSSPGGQVAESGRIENYPGFKRVNGFELTQRMIEQAEGFGVEIFNREVTSIDRKVEGFLVSVGEKFYEARSVILAIGVKPRKLGVSGEEELIGKGVSYCALCDAPLYKDKVVAMIGGGDSALDGALELSEHVKKIYLIHRRDEFRAKPDFVKRTKENPKIEFILNTNVTRINGEDQVESVTLDDPYRSKNKLSVEGVFVEIGNVPDKALIEGLGLDLDDVGYIKVSEDMSTSIKGIFAAGDITTGSNGMKQIVTACSEGAIAAQSVYRYLGAEREDAVEEKRPKEGLARKKARLLGNSQSLALGNRQPGNSGSGEDDNSTGSEKRLVVDRESCIGCGLCTTIAKSTFAFGDDGKAEVEAPRGDPEEKIQDAIDSCPVNAISWS